KIHEIKVKELPELDDEFAKEVDDEVETLDELKEKKQKELEKRKQQEADQHMRETLTEQATDNATVDIPNVMIETEVDHIFKEFDQRMQAQGIKMEMYSQFSGQDENEIK